MRRKSNPAKAGVLGGAGNSNESLAGSRPFYSQARGRCPTCRRRTKSQFERRYVVTTGMHYIYFRKGECFLWCDRTMATAFESYAHAKLMAGDEYYVAAIDIDPSEECSPPDQNLRVELDQRWRKGKQ